MRKAIAFTIITLLSMVLVGCAMRQIGQDRDEGVPLQAADSSLPGQEAPVEESVDEMSEDLAEIDALDDDLAELEGLEDDLDLDLQ